jgi:hypothetical protein
LFGLCGGWGESGYKEGMRRAAAFDTKVRKMNTQSLKP